MTASKMQFLSFVVVCISLASVQANWLSIHNELCDYDPPLIANGTYSTVSFFSSVPNGGPVTYKCDPGFELRGQAIVYCSEGAWTETPTCIASKGCPEPPPSPKYGRAEFLPVPEGYNYTHVVFRCDDAHELLGIPGTFCNEGKWYHREPPICYINYCASRPCGLEADCENREGHYTCSCGPGYVGDPYKKCRPRSRCRGKQCPRCVLPTMPENLKTFEAPKLRYKPGDDINYYCSSNTQLSGSLYSICQNDGTFFPPPPQCKELRGRSLEESSGEEVAEESTD
ncbi:unnamed protein product [Clavelina lepadiformis]|uniref:Uncharacterized protein n=1 Tax=Clavelina lepadiformis TaxID=159417 RepID=A0ABP0F2N4_CLALP